MNRRMLRDTALVSAIAGAAFFAGRGFQPEAEGLGLAGGCRISGREDESARMLELIAKRALRRSAQPLRSELGAGAEGDVEIRYLISVSEDGRLKLVQAQTSCGGARCPGESELPEMIGLLLADQWGIKPPGRSCFLEMGLKVPALSGGDSPLIRIPSRGKGVEL